MVWNKKIAYSKLVLQFLNAIFQSLQIWYKSTDSNVQCRIYIVYSRVEWFTVEHGHYAANHLNMLIWPRARGAYAAKFSLSKTHRILKNKYILLKICKYLSFTSRTITSRKCEINFFCSISKFVFDLVIWGPWTIWENLPSAESCSPKNHSLLVYTVQYTNSV